jgi:hypothetical protein
MSEMVKAIIFTVINFVLTVVISLIVAAIVHLIATVVKRRQAASTAKAKSE